MCVCFLIRWIGILWPDFLMVLSNMNLSKSSHPFWTVFKLSV